MIPITLAGTGENLAVAVDLPQFTLGVIQVASGNHQLVKHEARTGTNAECVLCHELRPHESTPPMQWYFFNYM
jgi:hypothetical protein